MSPELLSARDERAQGKVSCVGSGRVMSCHVVSCHIMCRVGSRRVRMCFVVPCHVSCVMQFRLFLLCVVAWRIVSFRLVSYCVGIMSGRVGAASNIHVLHQLWRFAPISQVLLATGATMGRDMQHIPGRELHGIHMAMDYLTLNTRALLDGGHVGKNWRRWWGTGRNDPSQATPIDAKDARVISSLLHFKSMYCTGIVLVLHGCCPVLGRPRRPPPGPSPGCSGGDPVGGGRCMHSLRRYRRRSCIPGGTGSRCGGVHSRLGRRRTARAGAGTRSVGGQQMGLCHLVRGGMQNACAEAAKHGLGLQPMDTWPRDNVAVSRRRSMCETGIVRSGIARVLRRYCTDLDLALVVQHSYRTGTGTGTGTVQALPRCCKLCCAAVVLYSY